MSLRAEGDTATSTRTSGDDRATRRAHREHAEADLTGGRLDRHGQIGAGRHVERRGDGARFLGIYPVSALAASIGLNATPASYHDSMDFGFVANAAAIDDLSKLVRHTLQAYKALTEAAGK